MASEINMQIPFTLAIVGGSGSGKTTLVERLIPELNKFGIKVGTIKHDAHKFEIDYPGKDSHRHKSAGAVASVITSSSKLALVRDTDGIVPVEIVVASYLAHCDIVLVEGHHLSSLPTIWVRRRDVGDDHIQPDNLLAVVTDEPQQTSVPCFPHGAAVEVARLIRRRQEAMAARQAWEARPRLAQPDDSDESMLSRSVKCR